MNNQVPLNVGTELKGLRSKYTVQKKISQGGQGGVYKVTDLQGKVWAAKWYWAFEDKQYQRILDLYNAKEPPALKAFTQCQFVWPLDVLRNNESFGYIMELKDLDNCKDYELILVDPNLYKYDFLCDISINLCQGFDKLHSSGFCYKDISKGNIFFDTKTRGIIIIDVDNVRRNSQQEDSDVIGTGGFIAPEVINGLAKPGTLSDRYSLAIMLFCLWARHESPFLGVQKAEYEGKNELKDIFGNPIFIFDPNNKKNCVSRAPKGCPPNFFAMVNYYWDKLPKELKDLFIRAFTDGIANDHNKRIRENEWVEYFTKFRDKGLTKCNHCSWVISIEHTECMRCDKKLKAAPPPPPPVPPKKNVLEIYEDSKMIKTLDIIPGKTYVGSDLSSRLAKIGKLIEISTHPTKPNLYGIKNLGQLNWDLVFANGTEMQLITDKSAACDGKIVKIIFGAGVSAKIIV